MARMLGVCSRKWADASYCCGKCCPGGKARARRRTRSSEASAWRREVVG